MKKQVKIPEVLFFQEGPGVRNTQYTTSGVKLLNVANLVNGKVDLSTSDRFISNDEAYNKYSHFLCKKGDFIIASSGIKVEYIDKKMGFITEEMLPLCMNTSTIRFRSLNHDVLNIRYFMYYLKSQHFKTQLEKHITGSAQLNYGPSHLAKMTIPLVDICVQNSIVHKLDTLSRVMDYRLTQLAKLDELVKCRFVELFGDAKNNPYGWVSETVDSVTEEIIGGVSVSGESRKIQKGELAVLKVSAVTYGVFKCDEYKVISNDIKLGKYVSPKKGDLLFSRANTKELVGATALVDKDYPHLLLPDKIWKIVVSDKVSPVYLKAYLSEPWIRELMSKVATGTSGSMYNISMEKLRQIPVILPPIERQNAFASFVSRIDKLRIGVQAALDKAQTLFDSLMQEYFG